MAMVIAAIGRLCFQRIGVNMAGSRRLAAGRHSPAPARFVGGGLCGPREAEFYLWLPRSVNAEMVPDVQS